MKKNILIVFIVLLLFVDSNSFACNGIISKIYLNRFDNIKLDKIILMSNSKIYENSLYNLRYGLVDNSEARQYGISVDDMTRIIVKSKCSVSLSLLKKRMKRLKLFKAFKDNEKYVWGWISKVKDYSFACLVFYNISSKKILIKYTDDAQDFNNVHYFTKGHLNN